MEDVDKPKPALRKRFWYWRGWSKWYVQAISVVVMLAVIWAAIFGRDAFLRWTTPDPEGVVQEYFDAILAGDADAALGKLYSHDDAYDDRFLTPEAIRHDWKVTSIKETARPGNSFATVSATVVGPEGSERSDFELKWDYDDNRWELLHPFAKVSFGQSVLSYEEVNGQRLDRASPPLKYQLFPGYYRFYEDRPGFVDVEANGVILVPRETGLQMITAGKVTPGPDLVASAQEAVRGYIDSCLRNSENDNDLFCQLGWRDVHVSDPYDISWTVVDYPVVNLKDEPTESAIGRDWTVVEVSPGKIIMRGKGDGGRTDFELTCALKGGPYSVAVGLDGVQALKPVVDIAGNPRLLDCGEE